MSNVYIEQLQNIRFYVKLCLTSVFCVRWLPRNANSCQETDTVSIFNFKSDSILCQIQGNNKGSFLDANIALVIYQQFIFSDWNKHTKKHEKFSQELLMYFDLFKFWGPFKTNLIRLPQEVKEILMWIIQEHSPNQSKLPDYLLFIHDVKKCC